MSQQTPVIAGALYQAEINGNKEQALCLSTCVLQEKTWGLFRRFNMAFDRFEQGSDDMASWELVSKIEAAPQKKKKTVSRPKKVEAKADEK